MKVLSKISLFNNKQKATVYNFDRQLKLINWFFSGNIITYDIYETGQACRQNSDCTSYPGSTCVTRRGLCMTAGQSWWGVPWPWRWNSIVSNAAGHLWQKTAFLKSFFDDIKMSIVCTKPNVYVFLSTWTNYNKINLIMKQTHAH